MPSWSELNPSSTERLRMGRNKMIDQYRGLKKAGHKVEASALKHMLPPTQGPGFNTRFGEVQSDGAITPVFNSDTAQEWAEFKRGLTLRFGHHWITDKPSK